MNELKDAVIRAIVHLNFNESEQALEVLLLALADSNFVSEAPIYGNRTANA